MIVFIITYICIFGIFFFWDIKTTKEEEKSIKEELEDLYKNDFI